MGTCRPGAQAAGKGDCAAEFKGTLWSRTARFMKQSFGKHERVRKRKEYSRIYQNGARLYSENFLVLLHPNDKEIRRLGITAGKKIGNAVKRNRAKRLLREFFRLNKDMVPPGRDVVITVRRDVSRLSLQEITRELEELLVKRSANI